jgi:hypothetical protein
MKYVLALVLLLIAPWAFAIPKDDYMAAINACAAANPDPASDARIVCQGAAWDAYKAAVAASRAPAAAKAAAKAEAKAEAKK